MCNWSWNWLCRKRGSFKKALIDEIVRRWIQRYSVSEDRKEGPHRQKYGEMHELSKEGYPKGQLLTELQRHEVLSSMKKPNRHESSQQITIQYARSDSCADQVKAGCVYVACNDDAGPFCCRSRTWGTSRLMEIKADRYMCNEVKEQKEKKDFLGSNCTTPRFCGRKIWKEKYWWGRLQGDGRSPKISLQTSLLVIIATAFLEISLKVSGRASQA